MPITSSAKKATRVSKRRTIENVARKQVYKRALKDARKAVATGDKGVEKLVIATQSALDRAVKSKLLHRNTASRLLSRLVTAKPTTQAVAKTKTKAKKKPARR